MVGNASPLVAACALLGGALSFSGHGPSAVSFGATLAEIGWSSHDPCVDNEDAAHCGPWVIAYLFLYR